MGLSFQNPVRCSLGAAGGSSPSFIYVPCAPAVLKHSSSEDVPLVTAAVPRAVPGGLAGSQLVQQSAKMAVGEIGCRLLEATNVVLNQKCLHHRENNGLFRTGSAPWELRLDGVLQSKRETPRGSWKSSVEYIFGAA